MPTCQLDRCSTDTELSTTLSSLDHLVEARGFAIGVFNGPRVATIKEP